MGAASTSGQDQPDENPRAQRLLITTIGCGILTALLAAITIALVTLAFLDRHFSLSTGLRDLWDVLAQAREVSAMTDGAFDVTVAPLVDLWGFGPKGSRQSAPTGEEIEAARASVNHRAVSVSDGAVS